MINKHYVENINIYQVPSPVVYCRIFKTTDFIIYVHCLTLINLFLLIKQTIKISTMGQHNKNSCPLLVFDGITVSNTILLKRFTKHTYFQAYQGYAYSSSIKYIIAKRYSGMLTRVLDVIVQEKQVIMSPAFSALSRSLI